MGFLDKLLGRKPKEEVSGITVYAPLDGELVRLSDVSDPTFGEGILGQGCAIKPSNGNVYAPFDGTVDFVANTKHAVSLTSKTGVELLIHVGLDTVKLDGAPFDVKVENGQEVKKGDLLVVADLEQIKAAGYDTITPVIVCNTDAYASVELARATGSVEHGTQVLKLTK